MIVLVGQVAAKSPPPSVEADVPANILLMLDTSGSMGMFPTDATPDYQGNVFVPDYFKHEVNKFDASGAFVKKWGSLGTADGYFQDPLKVAVDSSNNVYVVDVGNNRIQKFDNNGNWLANINHNGALSIDIDSSDNIIVGDSKWISIYNTQGKRTAYWHTDDGGVFWGVSAYDDFIYAVKGRTAYKYDYNGGRAAMWTVRKPTKRTFSGDFSLDIEVNSNGVYIAATNANAVYKYNHSGSYQDSWGQRGRGDLDFYYSFGIGSDSLGNIFVADLNNQAVKKFNSNGAYISKFGHDSGTRLSKLATVIQRIVSNPDLSTGANFGLMLWNSKATMEVEISPTGASEIFKKVDKLTSGGGTKLDLAMELAEQYMYGPNSPINKNITCQKNFLIVLSDGTWIDKSASRIAKNFNSNGVKTFVVGFQTTGNDNYIELSKNGGTYPESPLYADNWPELYETLSDYIRQAISSRITSTSPVIMFNIKDDANKHILQASFDYMADHQWKGELTKYKIQSNGMRGDVVWEAGKKLNNKDESSRKIWTVANWSGVPSDMNNFTTTNQTELEIALYAGSGKSPNANEVSNLINFVRGIDTFDENKDGSTSDKRWKLGDIYHSQPAMIGPPSAQMTSNKGKSNTEAYYRYQQNYSSFKGGNRKEVVYAGSNDGMLHAFDSNTGDELWAFIPPNLLPKLRGMVAAKANTSHTIYGVDGSLAVEDIFYDNKWRTILLAGLGRGGHGYFALDITKPTEPSFLFAFSNSPFEKIVRYWDSSGNKDEYLYTTKGTIASYDFSKLGQAWSTPKIFLMPIKGKQKWVAVFGAGYNNAVDPNYGSAIYVIDLEDKGKILKQINIADNSGNIVNSVPANITLIKANKTSKYNYKGAMAYVVDLEGKLWKINFTDKGNLYDYTQIFDAEATHENDRMAFLSVRPSIGNDDNLWLYYGTGNQQKLQRISPSKPFITNRIYGIKDINFPLFKTIKKSSTVKKLQDTTDKGAICPTDADLGWYVNLDKHEKVTGELTVKDGIVSALRYTPKTDNICRPGTSKLTEHNYACGNTLRSTNLGEGIATGMVIYKDKGYIGITGDESGDIKDEGGNVIGEREDNLIVLTPLSGSSKAKGSVSYESWREIF